MAGLADSRQRMFVEKKVAYYFAESLSLCGSRQRVFSKKKKSSLSPPGPSHAEP